MLAIPLILLATLWGSDAAEADCSKAIPLETLDMKSLEGKWYELSSYGTVFSHGLDRCQVTTIKAASDGKSFVMANDRIARLFNTHVKSEWVVDAKGDKPSGDLTLKFKLPLIGSVSIPLKILGTDEYKNYVIFHACYSFASIFKFNSGFILTKKRHYEDNELKTLYTSIDEILKKNGLSRSQFSLSIQNNCDEGSTSSPNTNTATAADKTSSGATQTTESSSSITGAAETSSATEPAAATEQSGGKTTTEPSEKTTSEGDSEKAAVASNSEKATATSETEKAAASETEKTATSETEKAPASETEKATTTGTETVPSS